MSAASAAGVAFGCVADAAPRFRDQTLRLVRSIRWFGGSLAGADVFVCCVGPIDDAWRAQLEALGALVRAVEPFNPHNRFSNKVRFFELPELARYETAVLLDCDMALVQDPAPFLSQPALQLMIADLPTVPSDRLAWLCERFGLPRPAPLYRTTCSDEPTVWYCNTAVTILPTAWIGRVLPPWRDYILRLCAEPELLDPPYNHCNQAAMTLTYVADPLPFAELPVAMNFPLHQTGRRPTEAMLRDDPVILHYHDRVDADGLLLPVPYPRAQARVEQLNARLRAIDDAPAPVPDPIARPAPADRPVALCVAGMHRSGTSLVAQILHRSGAYLGPVERLAAPSPDNLDGYWEHPEIHDVNEALLAHFGGGWDLPPRFPDGWADLPEIEPLRERARELVGRLDGLPAWGWKDPRSSLTLPFWQRLVPGLKTVVCVRDPLAVAQSLSRRGMSSLAFGLRLWQTYYERLLASVAPEDRIVTHYDRYFEDPLAETWRVLAWLGIAAAPDRVRQACGVTADALRHHRAGASDLLAVELPPAVLDLYLRLCAEAGVAGGAAASVAAALAAEDQADPQPTTLAARLAAATALLREQDASVAELRPALATCQTELAIVQHMLRERNADLVVLREVLAAREAEIAGFADELTSVREVLAAREAEIAGFADELGSVREVLAAREAEIAGFADELTSVREVLAAREAEIAAGANELTSVREVLAAREAEIAGFADELTSVREVLAAREAEIAAGANERQGADALD